MISAENGSPIKGHQPTHDCEAIKWLLKRVHINTLTYLLTYLHVWDSIQVYSIQWISTSARSGATPRPTSEWTANALKTHDVIVSGIVAVIIVWPSALHRHNKFKLLLYNVRQLKYTERYPPNAYLGHRPPARYALASYAQLRHGRYIAIRPLLYADNSKSLYIYTYTAKIHAQARKHMATVIKADFKSKNGRCPDFRHLENGT